MQLLLAPLVPYMDTRAPPTVFGVSGYSGAGTVFINDPDGRPVTAPKVNPTDLHRGNGLRPYSLTDHIHERETSAHLSRLLGHPSPTGPLADEPLRVAFVPVVASWFSGILSTASVPLTQAAVERRMGAREFKALYEEQYAGEKLVKILSNGPEVGDVEGQHGWVLGGVQLHSGGERIVAVGGLDNLLKGAATQCLQVSLKWDGCAMRGTLMNCIAELEPCTWIWRVRGDPLALMGLDVLHWCIHSWWFINLFFKPSLEIFI